MIYRQEAEQLLSPERRHQLALVYLEFAQTYFKPPKEDASPDYEKAIQFFQKALETGLKPDRRAEVELLVGQCYQNLNKFSEAAKVYSQFIQDHPASPLEIDARFRLGECRLSENLAAARRIFEDLLAKYPDSKSDRVPAAAFQISRTYGIPEPATDKDLSRGVAALESFLDRFGEHKLAGEAHLEIAKSYLHRGRHDAAVTALTAFLKNERLKDRKEMADGWNLLGRAYQLQRKFPEALAAWREYLRRFPAHEAWSRVQEEIVTTEYLMGLERYKARDWSGAARLLGEFLAKYPLDHRGPGILFLFGQMDHQAKKYDVAIADWRRLAAKYPGTNEASWAQFMIASTLEQPLGRFEEALEEYRKVTTGSRAEEAARAAGRLTAKTMTVVTERIFRSGQSPQLKLTTRNIEAVTVRMYQVDLETYFRKTQSIGGVEQLDISLIDPDRSLEFKVPRYAKYEQVENPLDLPLPSGKSCGVMAVTVTGKALEATALVIQSDLDIVVKSSRDEVFVFAENMKAGKPWPGARLLVSDGRQIIAEGKTDEQGVFRTTLPELKSAQDIRVFAAAEGNVASNQISLHGAAIAEGLADKGYLYTDMPAYRPGQQVCVRGCLRRAAGDAYAINKGKKYTLESVDARGRLLHRQEVALGPFGSFHGEFTLPPTSPEGDYRVYVWDDAGKTYGATFSVREHRVEQVRMVVNTPRRIYYRGELIEGTIRASWYYGAPLADREVRYALAKEPAQIARTDTKGEIRFSLPTREFDETQTLPLVAMLSDENLQTTANFFLATQGFSIDVTTPRAVVVAGEPFEVTLRTTDPEGQPTGQQLSTKVMEVTDVEGTAGERLVEEHPVRTAAAEGLARQTLKLEKGGRYRIRVEGTDRFKNLVSAETMVQICDDEDQTRLRILADRHTYQAGETADMTLYWREEPALALVTLEGSRMLAYRLVQLKKGPNKLSLPMAAWLAPNFELAATVMTDRARHGGKSWSPGFSR